MKHCTDQELHRRITACFDLRTATQAEMIIPGTVTPRISPLSPEWADAAARYDALAAESDRLYAILLGRAASHA